MFRIINHAIKKFSSEVILWDSSELSHRFEVCCLICFKQYSMRCPSIWSVTTGVMLVYYFIIVVGPSAVPCQRFELIKSVRVFPSRPGGLWQVLRCVSTEEKMLKLADWLQGIWFQYPPAVCIIKPNFPEVGWHAPVTTGLSALGLTNPWQCGHTTNWLEDKSVYLTPSSHSPGFLTCLNLSMNLALPIP